MVRSGTATLTVNPTPKIPTVLEIYVTDENWNVISTRYLNEKYKVVAVLMRADTGEPVRGKGVLLTITMPDGTSTQFWMTETDGHYFVDFFTVQVGVHQYQAEFRGDATYEGCEHHAEAELVGVGVFEW